MCSGDVQEETVDAVVVKDLRKSYGDTRAVAGVSFTVRYGEIFSLLGPERRWQDDGAGDP
jgi:ABC-type branched-subunit amino acid transport system ATPase component